MAESLGYYDPILGVWWFSSEASDTLSEWTLVRAIEEFYAEMYSWSVSGDTYWHEFDRRYIQEAEEAEWLNTSPSCHRNSYIEE
jgi:hypothetical protein